MAVSAGAARAILVSYLSVKPPAPFLQPVVSHRPPSLLVIPKKTTRAISCLISSGFEGDEFVSTRNLWSREFAVLANMLKRIDPLDNSIISKGVSDSAKDSMKQTISTMLGLLPSHHFSVTVTVSKLPLHRFIVSSILTGYTLWNAEYRISLNRNFNLSVDTFKGADDHLIKNSNNNNNGSLRPTSDDRGEGGGGGGEKGELHDKSSQPFQGINPQNFHDLSPDALNYIQQLELDLSAAKQELQAQKQENLQMENIKKGDNNLLEYLRSLESEMITELSRPSSAEVEEVIHELSHNILVRICKEEIESDHESDLDLSSAQDYQELDNEIYDVFCTSRDYLAKLLFWCMLLGHHLKGLENRLHLSCVVGLL